METLPTPPGLATGQTLPQGGSGGAVSFAFARPARLYPWTQNSAIPADNNRAERELCPLVIARKISFGSQSEHGAQTREILMRVLHTLRKRTNDVFGAFKRALDALAKDQTRDPFKLLFDSS